MARVLEGFHSFTCTPTHSSAIGMSHTCLCLPSRSWYSFARWKAERPWCEVAQAKIRTCNFRIANPALYHTATSTPWNPSITVLKVPFDPWHDNNTCLTADQQCQSTGGKISHSTNFLTTSSTGDHPVFSLTAKGSQLPFERVARPLVSPLMGTLTPGVLPPNVQKNCSKMAVLCLDSNSLPEFLRDPLLSTDSFRSALKTPTVLLFTAQWDT